jgi:hypothetical protein
MDSTESRGLLLTAAGEIQFWGDANNNLFLPSTVGRWIAADHGGERGQTYVCGIHQPGSLLCWSSTSTLPPPALGTPHIGTMFVDVHCLDYAFYCCALGSAGKVSCFGTPRVAVGSYADQVILPPSSTRFKQICVCSGNAVNVLCGILQSGAVHCFGTWDTVDNLPPISPPTGTNWQQISCGGSHVCVTDGATINGVLCFGHNLRSRTSKTTTPTPNWIYSKVVTKVSCGHYHTCALSNAGEISC